SRPATSRTLAIAACVSPVAPSCSRRKQNITLAGEKKRLGVPRPRRRTPNLFLDRKSTRLNSSHSQISYAVFCLKKKKITNILNETKKEFAGIQSATSLQNKKDQVYTQHEILAYQ